MNFRIEYKPKETRDPIIVRCPIVTFSSWARERLVLCDTESAGLLYHNNLRTSYEDSDRFKVTVLRPLEFKESWTGKPQLLCKILEGAKFSERFLVLGLTYAEQSKNII